MNRSDIKRGLAVTAVTALAVAGIASNASANPVNAQVGDGNVVLYSQSTGVASVKGDGANETVRLQAGAGSDVTEVKFQYRIGTGSWVDIATVSRNDNGSFQHEWAPPAVALGNTVDIKAVGLSAAAAVVDEATRAAAVNGSAESVDLPAGDAVGVYQSPHAGTPQNVVVSGTTSAAGANVAVSMLGGDGNAVAATTETVTAGDDKEFTAVVDIAGQYTYGTGDQIVIGAESGSDDVEAFSLYKQTVTTVTATPKTTQVPNGGTTDVTVLVADQNGEPIAGAQVFSSAGGAAQLTGAAGTTTFAQGAGTAYYYANATASDPFEAELGDKKSSDVTVTQYLAGPVDLVGASKDGAAFDLDENAAGDITVDVVDSAGASFNPATAQDLKYRWVITPFDGSAVVHVPGPAATDTATLADDLASSKFSVPLPGAGVEGTYELYASLAANSLGNGAIAEEKVLTVKAGEAEVDFDAASPQSELIGGTVDVTGKLVLDDGTALPNRVFTASYASAGNAALVTVTGDRTTDGNGAFSVSVKDPATPDATELGGVLTVTGGTTPEIGANTDATANQGVDFVTDQVPDGAVLTIDQDGAGTPGRAEGGTVELEDKDGNDLAGVLVTLTVDHGFFTDGSNDPKPAEDGLVGELRSLGEEITVATNHLGEASFQTAIERDQAFDDDGKVTATAAGAVDGVTADDTVVWDTTNPLNYGSVSVELTPQADQDGPVSPAVVGQQVWYDVFATDQFGNPVRGGIVDIECTDEGGADHPCPATAWLGDHVTDLDDGGDFSVRSDEAGVYNFAAVLDYTANVYSAAPAPTTKAASVTDEFATEWYEIDFAASSYDLERTPAGETVAQDATVTETVTVIDQEGNPVSGLHVDFVRTGDPNETRFTTNHLGQASYVFRATNPGPETVTAVVRLADGTIVQTLEDTMTVVGEVEEVQMFLQGKNTERGDRLHVFSSDDEVVAGEQVDLFKRVDGGWKPVGNRDAIMGSDGAFTFVVKDRNGDGRTKYRAEVGGVSTNPVRVR